MPSEKRSLRGSTGSARACSGLMKKRLPFTTPACVRVVRSSLLTMPKSSSFTSPRAETIRLLGETSRCTRPMALPASLARVCA